MKIMHFLTSDGMLAALLITAMVVLCYVAGFNEAADEAIDRQLAHGRLMAYCQQPGAIETLCHGDTE